MSWQRDRERRTETTKETEHAERLRSYVLKGNTDHVIMQVPTLKLYSSNSYNCLVEGNTPPTLKKNVPLSLEDKQDAYKATESKTGIQNKFKYRLFSTNTK